MDFVRIPLEVLKSENPCPANWDEMKGDERTRFCEGCKKYVHNLSAMVRDAAERLVCESAGNLCVRMTIDRAGKVLTVDYAGEGRRSRRRGWRFWTGIGLLGALLSGGLRAYLFEPDTCTVAGAPMPIVALGTMPSIAPSTQSSTS